MFPLILLVSSNLLHIDKIFKKEKKSKLSNAM